MQRDIPQEIVKAFEAGIDNYLARSIKYSPFRLFYNMFKRSNPQLVSQVREMFRNDILEKLLEIPDFNPGAFVQGEELTIKGKKLLQICYNIGIHLLKKRLNVVTAFRVIQNADFRHQIYTYVLQTVKRTTSQVLHTHNL